MIDKQRKKEHMEVLRYVQKLNKNIGNDEYLGKDRFSLKFKRESWNRFEDGSGGELFLYITIYDNLTKNTATFFVDNFDYKHKLYEFANDFLIRCSSGRHGHFPHLHYAQYDVHSIISYNGDPIDVSKCEQHIIANYNNFEKRDRWHLF